MENDIKKKKHPQCPYCGSTDTAYYIYGEPVLSKKLLKELKEKKCILGGCNVNTEQINGNTVFLDPSWRCNKCKNDF